MTKYESKDKENYCSIFLFYFVKFLKKSLILLEIIELLLFDEKIYFRNGI